MHSSGTRILFPCEGKPLDQVASDDQGDLWLSCGALFRRHGAQSQAIELPSDAEVSDLVRSHDGRVIVVGDAGRSLLCEGEPAAHARAIVLR